MLNLKFYLQRRRDRKVYRKHIASPNPSSPEWEYERLLYRKRALQLTMGELRRISKGDFKPLLCLSKDDWVDAIHSVKLPKGGKEMHLDLKALLKLASLRASGGPKIPLYTGSKH